MTGKFTGKRIYIHIFSDFACNCFNILIFQFVMAAKSATSIASSGFGHRGDINNEDSDEQDIEAEGEEVHGGLRGAAKEWVVETNFDSAVLFLDSRQYKDLNDNYNIESKKVNKAGDIIRTWVCKFSKKKKGFNCQVKARTVMKDGQVEVSRLNGEEHEHERVDNRKNFNFSPEAEAKIVELVGLNVESRQIRKFLVENGHFSEETAPSEKVLYNKTYKIRQKLNKTRRNIGLRELEELIETNKLEPEDDKEPFIVKHSITEDTDGRLRYSILFTSKYLVEKFMQSGKNWVLSVDSTYQTNSEDCPLIFFGSCSKYGKFNGIGAILSNREDKKAFDFLFEFVKENAEPSPTAVMADADKAISSSIKDKLPGSVRLTCFFHVMKNVKQKLAKVKSSDKAVYNKILDDLRSLQAGAVDDESFSILYDLFKQKWLEQHQFFDPELKIMVTEFFLYFEKV